MGINIVPSSECNGRSQYNGAILKGMQCAGVRGGGKSACQGDAGGPVTFNNQVVGIQSWAYGCAQADYPDVFTDVAVYRTWIDGELRKKREVILESHKTLF